MLVQVELEIIDAIALTLRDVQEDPTLLDEVFGTRGPHERDEIMAFFGARPIPVHPGFPRDAAELPGYYVNLGASRESLQPIGSLAENSGGLPDGINETEGAFFDSSVRVSCVAADNANLPIWLGEIVRWGLLRYRDALDARGLLQQTLSFSDFEPMPSWFPTLAFRRDCMVAITHFAGVVKRIPALREITAEASSVDTPMEHVSASVRH